MGTKRKASGRTAPAKASSGWEPKGGRMGPITTFEDVADSEDEFHLQRDKITFDEPGSKRRRYEDEELSDEEVLGYGTESEEEDDDEEEGIPEDEDPGEDGEEAEERWGTSKKDYYNADEIQTEEQAEMELAEARRLQKKRLEKYAQAGDVDDELDWLNASKVDESESRPKVVVEVLKEVEITAEMDPEEKMAIIRTRYPEFEPLAEELVKLQPLLQVLMAQVQADGPNSSKDGSNKSNTVVKCRALGAYLACLAMYFALLQSPAETGGSQLLHANEIHDHPVMDSIAKSRELWEKVKNLKQTIPIPRAAEAESVHEIKTTKQANAPKVKKSKKQKAIDAAASQAAELREQRMKQVDKDLEGLTALIPKSRKVSKKSEPVVFRDEEDNSDFGEEATMSAKAATAKEKKKKSLQFYTSHITQKANKRAAAGRDVGGDMDVPHRERLRDRQIRLNAEAEARGKKLDEAGRGRTDLGSQSDDEDAAQATQVRDEEDDYYDLVAQTASKRKQDKADKYDAIQQAKAENGLVRVVEGEVGEDGKRAIGYVIEKNKGLAPKRKKDVRNPRVKKRKKFEEKMKKLGSTRAIYKGGEERGGYGGEKTGIKTGLVKSVKL